MNFVTNNMGNNIQYVEIDAFNSTFQKTQSTQTRLFTEVESTTIIQSPDDVIILIIVPAGRRGFKFNLIAWKLPNGSCNPSFGIGIAKPYHQWYCYSSVYTPSLPCIGQLGTFSWTLLIWSYLLPFIISHQLGQESELVGSNTSFPPS